MDVALIYLSGVAAMVAIVAVRYLAVSGGFAALTRARHPDVYAPADPIEAVRLKRQMRREILWSLSAAAIYGVPAGLVAVMWKNFGLTRIYVDPLHYGGVWLPLSVLTYLFIHDSYFYWTHRLMHRQSLFAAVHAVHHESRPPTAWAAMSFHPWESLAGALLVPALALIIPIHWAALGVVLGVMTLFGVTNHMGWELFPQSWLKGWFGTVMITASHHHLHHRFYRCNYGLYFRFWDRICGTDRGWAKELIHDDPAVTAAPAAAAAPAGSVPGASR